MSLTFEQMAWLVGIAVSAITAVFALMRQVIIPALIKEQAADSESDRKIRMERSRVELTEKLTELYDQSFIQDQLTSSLAEAQNQLNIAYEFTRQTAIQRLAGLEERQAILEAGQAQMTEKLSLLISILYKVHNPISENKADWDSYEIKD